MKIDPRSRSRHWAAWCGAYLAIWTLAASAAPAQNAPAAEPAAIRVWSSDIHDAQDTDGGGPAAITAAGARNGAVSGKVVVGAAGPVVGLKATASDLKGPGGTIPAGLIRIRYAVEWDDTIRGRARPKGADILLDSPPAEAPGGKVPVWVTIRVPNDAKAGSYAGELTIEAKASAASRVPIKLEVLDWTLPAPQDYRTWVEMVQSPDTLAVEYDVPLWSQRHWDLISQSFGLLSDTGSRIVYVPLICQTNQGNAETMVRWVNKGQDRYEHDFSVMEKYLDLAEKHLGRPKTVVIYAWDVLLTTPPSKMMDPKDDDSAWLKGEKERMRARAEQSKKGIPVTCLEAAKGEANTIHLPLYTDPAGKNLWQPVWKGVRERLEKRGLEKAAMLGMLSDWRPSKPEAALLHELSGGMQWASCSHHLRGAVEGRGLGKLDGGGDVGLAMIALDFEFVFNPDKGRLHGWKKNNLQLHCWQSRNFFNSGTLSTARQEAECNITGGQRGIGHIGADFWQCIRNKAGARVATVTDRWPQAYWHSMNIVDSMLAPGPAGPAATVRLELFREGLQECEARIAIEAALTDEALKARLGPELARKAQETLDERQRALWRAKGAADNDFAADNTRNQYINLFIRKWNAAQGNAWFASSGWQERTARLFAIAGEVQRKLGK